MEQHGWTLLFHEGVIAQLRALHTAAERAERADPEGFQRNANVKLLRALSHVILETVPLDPARDEFRQGNTLGPAYRHWRRVKIGRRFRLFFRYDSRSRIIVFAWVNDEQSLRASGSRSDPYAVFVRRLSQGNPPDDWASLVAASKRDWLNQGDPHAKQPGEQ